LVFTIVGLNSKPDDGSVTAQVSRADVSVSVRSRHLLLWRFVNVLSVCKLNLSSGKYTATRYHQGWSLEGHA
jgi:hypothetical protein